MNAVVKMPNSEIAPITPMTMLSMAVSQGADLDKLEKLMALQERWEANEARKAFNEAMGAFRAEGITVAKDSRVTYKTDKGVTDYVHASLGNICNVVGGAMAKYGLSYRWNTQQIEGRIKVTCIVSHKQGHSESVSLEASADSSGGKNNIQAIGSTVSYLERYTLLAATGTATEDDDGRGGDNIDKKDNPKTGEVTPAPKPALEACSAESFDAVRAKHKTTIQSGKKTPADLIAWLSAKTILSEEQKFEIDSWRAEAAEFAEVDEPGAAG